VRKVFTPRSVKNMRLVPSAIVSVVYSEAPKTQIRRPKFSVIDGCVYNQNSIVGVSAGGAANIETLSPDQVAIMQYVEYRKYAVESS
jgi:hypothetical protein